MKAAVLLGIMASFISLQYPIVSYGADINSMLIAAAKSANLPKVEKVLNQGANINTVDHLGKTALFWACNLGHSEIAKLLLDKGADANIRDKDGMTALMEAARVGREELVRILLENREAIRIDLRTFSDVLYAAREQKMQLVGPLRAKFIELDARDNKGNTALMWAAISGRVNVAAMLLEKGANLNIRNRSGLTVLDIAERNRHIEVAKTINEFQQEQIETKKIMAAVGFGNLPLLKELAAKGVSLNVQNVKGVTPLIYAVSKNNLEIAKFLLSHGALIDARDSEGNSALNLAAKKCLKEMAIMLLNRGADPQLKNNNNESAVDAVPEKCSDLASILKNHEKHKDKLPKAVQEAINTGQLDEMMRLLNLGAIVNHIDSEGKTALHVAARAGNKDLVELLIQKGADVNVKDSEGDTPLMATCRECKSDVIGVLLANGADANVKDSVGYTALKIAWDLKLVGDENCSKSFQALKSYLSENSPDYKLISAAEAGDMKLVQELLDKVTDIDAENELEETALMAASREGHAEIVNLLIKKGPELGRALASAAEADRVEIVKILLNAGAEIPVGALTRVSELGHEKMVEFLLDKGANINEESVGDDGESRTTPLIQAAGAGHTGVVKLLVSRGADLAQKDHSGKSAIDAAADHGHFEIVDYLKSEQLKFSR